MNIQKTAIKVSAFPQMSRGSYEEVLKIFASAHHGISHGNLRGKELMYDEPSHIFNENGVSLLGGNGYRAIVTRPSHLSLYIACNYGNAKRVSKRHILLHRIW